VVVERRYSHQREDELTAAHQRIMEQKEHLDTLVSALEQNTKAIAEFTAVHQQLVALLQMRERSMPRRSRCGRRRKDAARPVHIATYARAGIGVPHSGHLSPERGRGDRSRIWDKGRCGQLSTDGVASGMRRQGEWQTISREMSRE